MVVKIIWKCRTMCGKGVSADGLNYWMTADGPIYLVRPVRGGTMPAGTHTGQVLHRLKRRPVCGQSRSTAGLGRMTFEAHKDATAEDCEAVAKLLTELAGEARKGNLRAFEEFWVEGGTEEGDAKVAFIREMMAMRFYHREEAVRSNS